MPYILKIGMTERTPEERIKELYTTGVALPFKIEFAKKVKDPRKKEACLHTLLEKYTDRVSTRREFFRVSLEEVRKFFDLMDGETWVESGVPLTAGESTEILTNQIMHEPVQTTNSIITPTIETHDKLVGFTEHKGIRLVTIDANKSDICFRDKFSSVEQALIYAKVHNYNCVTRKASENEECCYWFISWKSDKINKKILKHTEHPKDGYVSYCKLS